MYIYFNAFKIAVLRMLATRKNIVKPLHNNMPYYGISCITTVLLITIKFCSGPVEKGSAHNSASDYTRTHTILMVCMHPTVLQSCHGL